MAWKILYYRTQDRHSPVEDFIDSLNPDAKSKIINAFDLMREFGLVSRMPHSKKLRGSKIWELRILGKDSIRIFYIAIMSQTFLILHGFIKKKQKTDRKEIKTAENRLLQYRKIAI